MATKQSTTAPGIAMASRTATAASNVVQLRLVPPPTPQRRLCNDVLDTISELEDLLALARTGEVQGIAYVANIAARGFVIAAHPSGATLRPVKTFGNPSDLQASLVHDVYGGPSVGAVAGWQQTAEANALAFINGLG
jgi:hypothetical protein